MGGVEKETIVELTDVQGPNIPQASTVHPSVDEESVADGDSHMALPGAGSGAFNDRAHPLERGSLAYLQSEQVVEVPAQS